MFEVKWIVHLISSKVSTVVFKEGKMALNKRQRRLGRSMLGILGLVLLLSLLMVIGLTPAVLSAVRAVPLTQGTTFTVNSLDDPGDGVCDSTECTLREAINAANAQAGEDSIFFSIAGPIELSDTLTNTGSVIINGKHKIMISGNHQFRVFHVEENATLTIQSLIVKYGQAKRSEGQLEYQGGGGIRNLGTLIIEESMLQDNSADYGGAIHNDWNGTVTITNSIISVNSAIFDGGGIYNNRNGQVNIRGERTNFTSNRAGKSGGALFNWEKGAVSIISGNFVSNGANHGGAIANGQEGQVTIDGTLVSGNHAIWDGGGIVNWNTGRVTITNDSRIRANEVGTATLPATAWGGGIHNSDQGTVMINESTLSENTSLFSGGGIQNSDNATVTISGSEIFSNTARFGGGIHNKGNMGIQVDIENNDTIIAGTSTISGNVALRDGGGIYNDGTLKIANSTIGGDADDDANTAAHGGGILNWYTGVLEISSSTVAFNHADRTDWGNGGGIENGCDPDEEEHCGQVTIRNSTLSSNLATASGGGIANWKIGRITIANSTLAYNRVIHPDDPDYSTSGGGIQNFDNGTVRIFDSEIFSNTARFGGGIHNKGNMGIQVDIENNDTIIAGTSTISGNVATRDGGGIYNDGTLKIANSTIGGDADDDANTAAHGGGIINWYTGVLEISSSTIAFNHADRTDWGNGGGIENGCDPDEEEHCGQVTIRNSTLSSNLATASGGGIANWKIGRITIANSTLAYNRVIHPDDPDYSTSGGGIQNFDNGTVKIFDSEIFSNTARFGGGIHNKGNMGIQVDVENNDSIIAGTSTISGNVATRDGGGVYNDGTLKIANSTIGGDADDDANTAAHGGGIINWYTGVLEISNSTIAFNRADRTPWEGNGGGIENGCSPGDKDCGQMTIRNSTLSSNSATLRGGGIANWDNGHITIINSTLAENTAPEGGSINNLSSIAVEITNSIIAYSPSGENCSGTISSHGYNLEFGVSCELTATGDLTNIDPLLGPLQDNGGHTWTHALSYTNSASLSPAIDWGSCRDTVHDQRGYPRPIVILLGITPPGDFCDIGAYELRPESATALEGEVVTVSTAPVVAGEAGASATLTNPTTGTVTVAVATYATNPTASTIIDVGGGFDDLRVTSADPVDTVVVAASFYYPSTIPQDTEADLILLYYTGSQWAPVCSSGPTAPDKDTTDNLGGTVSGGRFSVTFDSTSEPLITELSGTVFVATINTAPMVEIGADATLNEGDSFSRTGSFSDPGSVSWTATVDYGDGSGLQPLTLNADKTFNLSHVYADDGAYSVTVTVCDDDDGCDEDSFTVTVNNVAPTVSAAGDTIEEGGTAAVSASFTDPGWLDTHEALIDWNDGTPAEAVTVIQGAGSGSLAASHVYGDNSTYTAVITVTDDDGGVGTATAVVEVANLAPSVSLDSSSAISFAGGDAFLGRKGIEQTHQASAIDPGSDDLTFAWNFGATSIYYNDGIGPDPLPSPGGVFPFSASDSAGVTFTGPGVCAIAIDVADDDGGACSANLPKLVTGDGDCTRSQGFWKHQFSEKGKHQVDDATLEAYLEIVNFASAVFSEQVPATTIEEAHDVMWARGPSMRDKAEAQLLAAWLNFAHGAVGWDELIDTDDDDVGDTPFHQVMSEAETILLDADATHEELKHAKDLAEAVNLHAP